MKYSDLLVEWLKELGYDRCFFVAGGNIMHLLDGVRRRMQCIPFVHEVAAGIGAEIHNETRPAGSGRAFVLVTAGPGLTNVVTAMAGAWLESRELLVLGGQVKTSDLARGEIRQRGIQEIDGVEIVRPISVQSRRLDAPVSRDEFCALVEAVRSGRPGPVFVELPLDVQGAPIDRAALERHATNGTASANGTTAGAADGRRIAELVREAERPVFLIGGGVSRETARTVRAGLQNASVAVMTTWNGMDRVDARDENYFGRPNQWGQRAANVLIQQADIVVAFGTRLGLQQTGFNWQAFAPVARVVQIEIDPAELEKGHPHVDVPIAADANPILQAVLNEDLGNHEEWLAFARGVRDALPLEDPENVHAEGYVDPYRFATELSELAAARDVVIPCSSGGGFTTMMQAFRQRFGQTIATNKGLAAMGYGLSAAIGAALANPDRRTILIEGDGGFAQNLQELATVAVNRLNLKMFIFSNEGYASIRMTQKNYFGGEYLGCDTRTGLGFPHWPRLFEAFDIPVHVVDERGLHEETLLASMEAPGPAGYVVLIDPEQTYFPKISSRVTANGSMQSAPLHLMSPDLPEEILQRVLRYLPDGAPLSTAS